MFNIRFFFFPVIILAQLMFHAQIKYKTVHHLEEYIFFNSIGIHIEITIQNRNMNMVIMDYHHRGIK